MVVEPALLGQLDRTAVDPVPVAAAEYPRFKLRPAPGRPGVELRELHVAIGTINAGSDAKTGTLELAVQVVPAEDPQPSSSAGRKSRSRMLAVIALMSRGTVRGARQPPDESQPKMLPHSRMCHSSTSPACTNGSIST
jgi:hypothetical protein